MSLVDYASSSEEEEEAPKPAKNQVPLHPVQKLRVPSNEQPGSSHSSGSPVIKLPDAALLLGASNAQSHLVSGLDHSSRVAAALAESASRKREANGPANILQRNKMPRGNLPHSRSVPDTGKGLLVPPQLTGRSNVVTEDISKLFVRKKSDPHLDKSESPV